MSKTPDKLTPQTLIKRVMSGTTTKEYLKAFGSLSSVDLHHPDYSKRDIIKLWNSLQNTPNKVRYFTFSLVDNNKVVQDKIKQYYDYDKWAYILHDKDKSAEHKHVHYYLEFENPRSFSSIANTLEIPVTLIEKVRSKKAMLDYLTHENDPNKHHYDVSEIVSNFDVEKERDKDGDIDIDEEFSDYCKMRDGDIPFQDWFDKWKYRFCDIKSPRERLRQYENFYYYKSSSSVRDGRACPRAEFRVPNPRASPPIPVKFGDFDPNKLNYLEKGKKYQI